MYFYIISSLSKPNIISFISCVTKYISYIDPQHFSQCISSAVQTPASNKQISQLSFHFSCNRWCSFLYIYDLQVKAGDNFLTCRHLMVVIILFRFFCFINIGYQFCKVQLWSSPIQIITALPFAVYFVTSLSKNIPISSSSSSSFLSLSILWNWYHFAFRTSMLCQKY